MNETQREIGEMDGFGLNLEDFLAEAEITTITHTTGDQLPTHKSLIPPLVGYTGRFYLEKPGFREDYEP